MLEARRKVNLITVPVIRRSMLANPVHQTDLFFEDFRLSNTVDQPKTTVQLVSILFVFCHMGSANLECVVL